MRVVSVLLIFTLEALAQQAPPALKNPTPLFENELVRVGRVMVAAGTSEGVHRHAYPRVLVCLEPGVIEVRRADGTVEKTSYGVGHARYQASLEPHEPVNVGETQFVGVVIELKKDPAPPTPAKLEPLDPLVVAGKFHKALVDNNHVRVLDVNVKPGESEPLHKHIRSVLIILQGGTAQFGFPDGSTREASFSANANPPKGQPPQVFWEGDETHSVRNIGKTPIRLIRVEIK
jgi:quercetin dioxygenase-like cupin family protein